MSLIMAQLLKWPSWLSVKYLQHLSQLLSSDLVIYKLYNHINTELGKNGHRYKESRHRPQEEQKGAGKYAPTLSTEHKMSVKENLKCEI